MSAVVYVIMAVSLTSGEPTAQLIYQGNDLTEWRTLIRKPNYSSRDLVPPDFPLRLNPDARAIPMLLALLRDEDAHVRAVAVSCLGYLKESALSNLSAITDALKDSDRYVQLAAIRALRHMGTVARKASPSLVEIMRHKDKNVQLAAADALLSMGESLEKVDAFVTQQLNTPSVNEDALFFLSVFAVVSEIPQPSKPLREVLITIAQEDTDLGGQRAIAILGKEPMRSKEIYAVLEHLLNSQHGGNRIAAAKALLDSTEHQKPVICSLLAVLCHSSLRDHDAQEAIMLLGKLGNRAIEALPLLRKLSENHPDPLVRREAMKSIGLIQP
jgi:HEAT repeat protein